MCVCGGGTRYNIGNYAMNPIKLNQAHLAFVPPSMTYRKFKVGSACPRRIIVKTLSKSNIKTISNEISSEMTFKETNPEHKKTAQY